LQRKAEEKQAQLQKAKPHIFFADQSIFLKLFLARDYCKESPVRHREQFSHQKHRATFLSQSGKSEPQEEISRLKLLS